MLNTHDHNAHFDPENWATPTRVGSDSAPETAGLLAALQEGWQILETAKYLAHGKNAEGLGYLLTLYNPHQSMTREWNVAQSPDVDALLAFESAPGKKL